LIRFHELKQRDAEGEPIYDICAVADMNEILLARAENERRSYRHMEKKNKDKK